MTVSEIAKICNLEVLNMAEPEKGISGVFCCDLLSIVMGKAFAGCAWVTVMGNINSIAVAALADMACIILADGAAIDEVALTKAREQMITVLKSKNSIFETALAVHQAL